MKICLLNDSFPPVLDGVANVVTNYAERLLENHGAEVVVGTPRYPKTDYSVYPYRVVPFQSFDTSAFFSGYRTGNPFSAKLRNHLLHDTRRDCLKGFSAEVDVTRHIAALGIELNRAPAYDDKGKTPLLEQCGDKPGKLERALKQIGSRLNIGHSSFDVKFHVEYCIKNLRSLSPTLRNRREA